MSACVPADHEERILILAPTQGDAGVIRRVLDGHGLQGLICENLTDFIQALETGAAVAVIACEALEAARIAELVNTLQAKPTWSALPVVILTETEALDRADPRLLGLLEQLPSVSLLERPLRPLTLVSVLRSALQGRRSQYVVRDLLAQTRQDVELRDRFLALLGHELRNPLAPLRYAVESLRFQVDEKSPLHPELNLIDRQVTQLNHLVDDMLDAARVAAGRIALARRPMPLAGALEEAVESVHPLIQERQQRLSLVLPEAGVMLNADHKRLVQVFTNLLRNATQYTPEGGSLRVVVEPEAETVWIHFRDSGIGIDSDTLPRLFDVFARVRQERHEFKGLGLGLPLVKRLTELHDGSIRVSSPGPGQGSEFSLRLPRLVIGDQPEPAPAPDPGLWRSLRILVVDDEPAGADALAELLARLGHQARAVYDGHQALDALPDWQPQLMLVDLSMPGLDGYSLARQLRRMPLNQQPWLVALTGLSQTEADRQETVFDGYLMKPIGLTTLKSLLAQAEGWQRDSASRARYPGPDTG